MVSEKVFRLAVNLLVGIWLARYLGPSDFGVYNFAIAIATIFLPLVNFGLHGILVKELFNSHEIRYKILGTSFILKLFLAIIVFIVITLICITKGVNLEENYVVLVVSVSILFQPFLVLENWFESQVRAKWATLFKSLFFIAISILKIIYLIKGGSLSDFAILYSTEAVFIALGLSIAYYKDNQSILRWEFDFQILKNLVNKSWLLVLSGISAVIYLKIDQIMLGTIVSEKELGVYSAAVKLSEAWYFIPLIISNALFPAILSSKKKSKREYIKRLQQLCDSFFTISILLGIIITFFASFIINTLYGKDYSSSIIILQIHIWAGVFIFLRAVLSKWLITEDLYKYSLISQLSGALSNFGLNLILIPSFGGIGAAVATVISYFVTSFLILAFFKDTKEIFHIFIKSFLLPIRLVFKHEKVS